MSLDYPILPICHTAESFGNILSAMGPYQDSLSRKSTLFGPNTRPEIPIRFGYCAIPCIGGLCEERLPWFVLFIFAFMCDCICDFVCATLQGLLVRALLLELLGMYTRSVLGNCLRINCVINFDQNTAGQNIDIPFLVLDVIWLDISMK